MEFFSKNPKFIFMWIYFGNSDQIPDFIVPKSSESISCLPLFPNFVFEILGLGLTLGLTLRLALDLILSLTFDPKIRLRWSLKQDFEKNFPNSRIGIENETVGLKNEFHFEIWRNFLNLKNCRKMPKVNSQINIFRQ